jgi:aquaporin Z
MAIMKAIAQAESTATRNRQISSGLPPTTARWLNPAGALRVHWPEYLIEASALGTFMISACVFTVGLEHPASPVRQAIASDFLRRALIGLAMGLTAIIIIYSPWGQRSGAHLNPSVTVSFLRLGKIRRWDALFYILAQFTGGVAGVGIAALTLGSNLSHTSTRYAVTVPGRHGPTLAFIAELIISFLLMTVVLNATNRERVARYTGLFAGALVAIYIALESPYSGMSMSPARTVGSAIYAHIWNSVWVYFTAPIVGMLLASELYLRTRGSQAVICAKLHHPNNQRCIFNCGYREAALKIQFTSGENKQ